MAVSIPIKNHFAQLLNNMEEMNSLLKNNLNDFDQQVKQATLEWFDNPSDAKIDFKEVVAMVTTVNTALLELKLTISVSCTKYQAMAAGDQTTQGNQCVDPARDVNYSDLSLSADLRNKLEQRVERLETTLSSLQISNKETEDDVAEIKQWRDTCTTEQSEMKEQIEQLALKQKHNSKQFRKQINEQKNITDEIYEEMKQLNEIKQWRETFMSEHNTMSKNLEELSKKQTDNNEKIKEQTKKTKTRINELNKEIENLKEIESNARKALESTNKEINNLDIILNKINEELEIHTYKTEKLQQEIKSHYDVISHLREQGNKNKNTETKVEKLMSMHRVTSKILQQRLIPVENLIQTINQSLASRQMNKQKLATLENDVLILSNNVDSITSRVCNRYACHLTLDNPTPVSDGSIISTFGEVREYNGQHFNQTTGTFVSPHDGLYLVCVTLDEWFDKLIEVAVMAGDEWCKAIEVKCADTSAAGSVVVDIKKGQELYLKVYQADQDAKLSCYSSFTIVSL